MWHFLLALTLLTWKIFVIPKSYPPTSSGINKNDVEGNRLKLFCNAFAGNHIGVNLKTDTKILKHNTKFPWSAEVCMIVVIVVGGTGWGKKIALQDILSIFVASVYGEGLECSISFCCLCHSTSSYGNCYSIFLMTLKLDSAWAQHS